MTLESLSLSSYVLFIQARQEILQLLTPLSVRLSVCPSVCLSGLVCVITEKGYIGIFRNLLNMRMIITLVTILTFAFLTTFYTQLSKKIVSHFYKLILACIHQYKYVTFKVQCCHCPHFKIASEKVTRYMFYV